MAEKICGIYMIKNTVNNKVYIGQSINTELRLREHSNQLIKGNHYNSYLQRSWNKYGCDNFNFTIIEECLREDLNDKEIQWIAKYNSTDKSLGYNVEYGGNCSPLHPDTKRKISESRIGKYLGEDNNYFGMKHTEEIREKMRKPKPKIQGANHYLFNKSFPEEWKEKIRETIGDSRKGSNNNNSKITEETVKEIIKMLLDGHTNKFIHETLNVSLSTIGHIKHKTQWKHLTEGIEFVVKHRKQSA